MVTRICTLRRRSGRRLATAAIAVGMLSAFGGAGVANAQAGATSWLLRAAGSTVWLCRPGQAGDPCAFNPAVTTVTAEGTTSVSTTGSTPASHAVDCFYVYPTVSTEPGNNANLAIQPAEIGAAAAQASQFSQVCDVWAPMYRQVTKSGLLSSASLRPGVLGTAYASLLAAWKDYLAHHNHGRPIVFIGHSQGAAMLIRLLRTQVDPSASLRKRMVSAILLGGNVQVPVGSDVGGSFRHIPTCRSASQTGCVVAFSSFGTPPPAAAFFGRPGQGVSLQSGQTAKAGQQVACVNPVTFSAQPGGLQPLFLRVTTPVRHVTVTTPWVAYPGLYTARCQQGGGASWLQVTATAVPGDPRPTVSAALGPLWGYHLADVNLALGNLVADVGTEEAAHH
jgi:hypothetical protein